MASRIWAKRSTRFPTSSLPHFARGPSNLPWDNSDAAWLSASTGLTTRRSSRKPALTKKAAITLNRIAASSCWRFSAGASQGEKSTLMVRTPRSWPRWPIGFFRTCTYPPAPFAAGEEALFSGYSDLPWASSSSILVQSRFLLRSASRFSWIVSSWFARSSGVNPSATLSRWRPVALRYSLRSVSRDSGIQ